MTAILRESEEQYLFISHWVRKSSSSEMVAILWRHMVIKYDNHPRLIMVAISYFVFVWKLISFYFVLFQAKVIIKCLFCSRRNLIATLAFSGSWQSVRTPDSEKFEKKESLRPVTEAMVASTIHLQTDSELHQYNIWTNQVLHLGNFKMDVIKW